MNNDKRVEFIGSIIIFFVLLFVYSKFGPSFPISVLTQTKGEPFIVSETGKVTVVPDVAKVSLGFEDQGQSLNQVQNNVNTKSKALLDSLKDAGIEEKYIKTTNYSVYPEYDYDSSPYRITGYRVSTAYEVEVIDFEKINTVLTAATEAGVNVIGNISFEVNEETRTELTNKAREEAVELAKEKAEGLAKAAGISLGKIINISESEGLDYPREIAVYDKATVNSAPEPASINPGETEISVVVSLSYEVR